MSHLHEKQSWMVETRYLGPARILGIDENAQKLRLRLEEAGELAVAWGRLAIPLSSGLQPGDMVLVLGEDIEDLYIIGVLNQLRAETPTTKKITLEGGTSAEGVKTGEGNTLRVFSGKQELLFEYDEKLGKARVNLESGDLEFITRNGNITFAAEGDILLNGKTVGVTSSKGIVLGMIDSIGKICSAFTLRPKQLKLNSLEIAMDAQEGDIKIDDLNYQGKKLSGNVDFAKLMINRMESMAQTVVTKAKNVYQTVEQLSQLKTGRLRTLVESTFHLKSKKTFIKAEEDVKVRGEKIHLG